MKDKEIYSFEIVAITSIVIFAMIILMIIMIKTNGG